jgi:hypothetical protein
MADDELAEMFAEMADAAGVNLRVAAHLCDAIDPRLPIRRRYAAAYHASLVSPVGAVAMAATFAAGMLAARYEDDPDGLEQAMCRIRARMATVTDGDQS